MSIFKMPFSQVFKYWNCLRINDRIYSIDSVSMNIEELREYCISKKGVSEGFPFGEDTLVFKVGGKMFALTNLDGEPSINLKCDPERAIELREQYPSIVPGYHMNKVHWNTVYIDSSLPENLLKELIDLSYDLVLLSLSKAKRDEVLRG